MNKYPLRHPTPAEQAIIDELVRAPHKIARLGQTKAHPCEGGCGRPVWGTDRYCRKCSRRKGTNQ